jgi:hypothetical protein
VKSGDGVQTPDLQKSADSADTAGLADPATNQLHIPKPWQIIT